jgi:filamentous hemagglutinin family protein
MFMARDMFTVCVQVCGLIAASLMPVCASHAEIVFDGTMGDPGNLQGTMIIPEIRGTLIQGDNSANLFHSFSVFNVNANESAEFTATTQGIANVISRVTGGDVSSIDGPIISNIGADLWLINPSGITFKENASLQVDGSFHASTAKNIDFDDGQFSADLEDPNNALLSVASPLAFGFLDSNPKSVIVEQSQLGVGAGKSLSFVGGDVDIQGASLQAPGGQINIISTASAGKFFLSGPAADTDTFSQLGKVTVSQNSVLSVSESAGSAGAGDIFIRGGNFTVNNSRLAANGVDGYGGFVAINVDDLSLMDGGVVDVATDGPGVEGIPSGIVVSATNSITISGVDPDPDGGSMASGLYTETFGEGHGGNIDLQTNSLIVQAGGTIDASTGDALDPEKQTGIAGDVLIEANDLELTGGQIRSVSTTKESGDAGFVRISADNVKLSGGGFIDVAAFGVGGDASAGGIFVDADSISIEGKDPNPDPNTEPMASGLYSETFGDGLGGIIELNAASVVMDAGGTITAESKGGGSGGDIRIIASQVSISGAAGIDTSTSSTSSGDAGIIFIDADVLTLTDGGTIESVNEGTGIGGLISIETSELSISSGALIDAATTSTGNAGSIEVDADTITITGKPDLASATGDAPKADDDMESGLYTDTFGDGQGGNIDLTANSIVIGAGGTIDASTGLAPSEDEPSPPVTIGQGGKITIATSKLEMDDGNVQVNTFSAGEAGSIDISADEVRLTGDAEIASDVEDGATGSGGGLTIDARTITLESLDERAPEISADTEGTGDAGNISLTASEAIRLLKRTPGPDKPGILANSKPGENNPDIELGNAGTITVSTPVLGMIDSEIRTSAENSAGGNIVIKDATSISLLDSEINATAGGINGGEVEIKATDLVYLVDSNINSTAGGDGGNVNIDPTFVVLKNSKILAQAIEGLGGDIKITATVVLLDPNSVIDAKSAAGEEFDGVITIDAPNQDVTAAVTVLDASFLDVSGLLRQPCSAAAERARSSFTVAGKGSVTRAPNTYFPSTPQDIQPPTQASRIEQQNGETFIHVADRQAIPWEQTEKHGCI